VKRLLGVVLAAAALAVGAGTADADPPHTCGRLTLGTSAYVIRAHRVTCTFAMRGAKGYLNGRHRPHGYACTAYQGSIPVFCHDRRHRSHYFMGTTG
jgi:hypothetical protein